MRAGSGQHLAEPVEAEAPGTGLLQLALKIGAEAHHLAAASPAIPATAALEPVAAHEVLRRRGHVPKARDVDAVGAIAKVDLVGGGVDAAVRSAAHDVIHDILAELSARVAEPRVEQDARGLERRRVEEDDASLELERVLRLAVDHAHARGFPRLGVVSDAV